MSDGGDPSARPGDAKARWNQVAAAAAAERAHAVLQRRERAGFAGVVLIALDGRVVLRRAYGVGGALAVASSFWIGSLSKPFTAAAILWLRDHGALSLADPIARHFDGVPADKQAITVHQLLTHSSGIADAYAADDQPEREAAVRAILAGPLDRAPGEGYGYSSDGYTLLAALIERVAGRTFESVVRESVLAPARMSDTGFWAEPAARRAAAPAAAALPPVTWGYRGGTGMCSTVDDLHRWHVALSSGQVLREASYRQSIEPQIQRSPTRAYGYGWQVLRSPRDTLLVAHAGAEGELEHHAALLNYADEGALVVLLSNVEEEIVVETRSVVAVSLFEQGVEPEDGRGQARG